MINKSFHHPNKSNNHLIIAVLKSNSNLIIISNKNDDDKIELTNINNTNSNINTVFPRHPNPNTF